MGIGSSSRSMRLNRLDAAWFAFAILAHASLFLIPLHQQPAPPQQEPMLSVSLLKPRPLEHVVKQPQQPVTEEPAPAHVQDRPEPATYQPSPEALPAPVEDEPDELNPEISTALLVDSASRMNWPAPKKDTNRTLGVHVPQKTPDNWRPRITVEDNRFNGMTVPATTEIVDRWLAADGSHNVVIDTPDGETYCGRAEAWNPMTPLVEHIMMFRKCGGGGARTFKMPDRFTRHLVD
jgi:hypothetical protein